MFGENTAFAIKVVSPILDYGTSHATSALADWQGAAKGKVTWGEHHLIHFGARQFKLQSSGRILVVIFYAKKSYTIGTQKMIIYFYTNNLLIQLGFTYSFIVPLKCVMIETSLLVHVQQVQHFCSCTTIVRGVGRDSDR